MVERMPQVGVKLVNPTPVGIVLARGCRIGTNAGQNQRQQDDGQGSAAERCRKRQAQLFHKKDSL